jgi:hypothetical protein
MFGDKLPRGERMLVSNAKDQIANLGVLSPSLACDKDQKVKRMPGLVFFIFFANSVDASTWGESSWGAFTWVALTAVPIPANFMWMLLLCCGAVAAFGFAGLKKRK